jgi:tRNA-splicing ligase RtcB
MKVPARIYADEDLLAKMRTDRTIQQCVNVTHLNGIYKYAITMPDGHEGYGFPIGGVAATDYDEGLISPGGVGYDINCGVRLIRTNLSEDQVRPALSQLIDTIFNFIPSGLGSRGQIKLSSIELLTASIGPSTKDTPGLKIRRLSKRKAAWKRPIRRRYRAAQDRAEHHNLEV